MESSTYTVRVASITYDYYPFEMRVKRLSEAVAAAGFDMDVICLRDSNEKARETYNGVNIYRVAQRRGFGKPLPLTVLDWTVFMLRAGALVSRLHLRRRYDVVHLHNMPDFLVFAGLIPKLTGARVMLDLQDITPELMAAKARNPRMRNVLFRLAALQERVSTRFADHIVTVGRPFEEKLLERGVAAGRMSRVLNSADPKLFPESRRCAAPNAEHDPNKPFVVRYWGTVAHRNGLDIAIRAVAQARASVPNLRLDIMGRGEQIPALKQLADELGAAECVRFNDPVAAEEVVSFIVGGDAGIIPYRNDGFAELVLPTKAYEIAWMRRPIIASDTPGMRAMFRPESAMLCQPEDPASFAAAIEALWQDRARCERMVASAAEDYAPYEWEKEGRRYAELLAQVSGKLSPAERSGVGMPAGR